MIIYLIGIIFVSILFLFIIQSRESDNIIGIYIIISLSWIGFILLLPRLYYTFKGK